MLDLLRYFGQDARVNAMRKAPASRALPALAAVLCRNRSQQVTPENEALNQYFGRISAANARFTDEGVPGWRTDRGEVFIALGAPDESIETTPGTAGRVVRWTYLNYRLSLFFQDETGFGRLRLTPGSRAEFERTLEPGTQAEPKRGAARAYFPRMSPNHNPPQLFLIDGYALIYRAFYAMISRPLRTAKGENTSAAWGVVNFLLRLREKYRPDYVAWINDAGTSFREQRYADYKSTREKLDQELQADFDRSVERICSYSRPLGSRWSPSGATRPMT